MHDAQSDSVRRAAPSEEPTAMLEVRDLHVRFQTRRGSVRAVDGVSFALAAGRTLGIVGESGSGKTVLSRSIMGLGRGSNVLRTGQIVFDGRDITHLPRRDARRIRGRDIAMVFQDPMTSLNPVMKIGRQLTEGMRAHLGMARQAAATRAVELLRSVGIPNPEQRMGQYPFELSGGMRQRVTIAIALACDPRLLLADEPTTALDVTIQAQILNLLEDQKRERGMAMILVTHDLGVVAGRTDETIVMYAGRIVEHAPTHELFTRVRMPYTQALLNSIPKLDEPSHAPLAAIGGRPPVLTDQVVGCAFATRCPYAQHRCYTEAPPLTTDAEAPTHRFACWYPVDAPTPPTHTRAAVTDPSGVSA